MHVHCHISGAEMFELTEIVIPKIKANWESLAYCMRYTTQEVIGFRKDSQDSAECCKNLLNNWISTGHGPKPKTYLTLLKCIKKIDNLTAASEAIKNELIESKYVIVIIWARGICLMYVYVQAGCGF